jgi:hypothetical protein
VPFGYVFVIEEKRRGDEMRRKEGSENECNRSLNGWARFNEGRGRERKKR